MVDHKQNKNEKVEQQNSARGFDKKHNSKDQDATAEAKKKPTVIKSDDESMPQSKKQPATHAAKAPAGGQEGMRPKAKDVDDDETKGAKSRNTPTSKS